jgi:hypothetical protein
MHIHALWCRSSRARSRRFECSGRRVLPLGSWTDVGHWKAQFPTEARLHGMFVTSLTCVALGQKTTYASVLRARTLMEERGANEGSPGFRKVGNYS